MYMSLDEIPFNSTSLLLYKLRSVNLHQLVNPLEDAVLRFILSLASLEVNHFTSLSENAIEL